MDTAAATDFEMVLVPSGIGRYVALLDGEPVIRPTRQPFFNAARALLALGHDPAMLIEARHRGSAIVAMRSTIGEAAKWAIEETDKGGLRKVPWRQGEYGRSRQERAPETGADVSAGSLMPLATSARVLEAS